MDNKNNNNDDERKKLIEQLEKLSKEANSSGVAFRLGFLLHRSFGMHILITYLINLLCAGIVIGFSRALYLIVEVYSFEAFFFAITLFTLIETAFKLISLRYIFKIVVQSLGLVFYITNLIIFWIVSQMVPDFTFLLDPANIFVFTIIFMMIRTLFTTYIRKIKWIQGEN